VQCRPIAFLPLAADLGIFKESPDRSRKYPYTLKKKDSYGFFRGNHPVKYGYFKLPDFNFFFCCANWV
jgi:hypothetical protein